MNMKSDAVVEDEAIDYFLDENLDVEAQQYLMSAIEQDPQLEAIFESVMMRAIEFSGAGEVDGAGTGTSDEIPARLSDGEFVFTAKAVDVIGVETLEAMMARAEQRADMGDTPQSRKLSEIDAEIDQLEMNG